MLSCQAIDIIVRSLEENYDWCKDNHIFYYVANAELLRHLIGEVYVWYIIQL